MTVASRHCPRLGDRVLITSQAAPLGLRTEVEVSDDVRPGVVSYPHGFGHRGGRWAVADRIGGINVNQLASTRVEDIEAESGSPHLDGIPVEIAVA